MIQPDLISNKEPGKLPHLFFPIATIVSAVCSRTRLAQRIPKNIDADFSPALLRLKQMKILQIRFVMHRKVKFFLNLVVNNN